MAITPTTLTTQGLIDYARAYDFTIPTVGLAGYSKQPSLSFANDVMQRIMNKNDPWKWNSYTAPPVYTQPFQQDFLTNLGSDVLGWLESATMTDINNNAGSPQFHATPPIQCVARLLPTFILGVPSQVATIFNRNAQTGIWPGPSTVYTNPLVSQGGGPSNNPLTSITDPNGNLQTVTTYGTTTSNAAGPTWPAASAAAGTTTTDGTAVWTVMDPLGITFRVNALASPNSNVWRLNIVYQKKPPLITTLDQTFAPIPDDYQYLIKQGFLAFCYKKVDKKNFTIEYTQWLQEIQEALGQSDREQQTFGIGPSESLQNPGGGSGIGSWGYPGFPGWS